MFTYSALAGTATRAAVAKAIIASSPRSKIVATHEVNLTNVQNDVQNATVAMVTAHPNLNAIYNVTDTFLPYVLAGLKQAGKSNVLVFTQDGNNFGNQAIKDGTVVSDTNTPFIFNGWMVADVLYRHFAGVSLNSNPFGLQGPIFRTSLLLVTKSNVDQVTDSSGNFNNNALYPDFEQKFKASWGLG
jgi:ABC-type sugar transport system substrate-binding protein